MPDISLLKQSLRQELSHKRQSLSDVQRQDYSTKIQAYASQYLKGKSVQQVLVYKALPVEVNTDTVLSNKGYETYVPQMLSDSVMQWIKVDEKTTWKAVNFGVLEPQGGRIWQPGNLNITLLCPLLGFDMQGNRLGMGKGYFDRWLFEYGINVDVVGLAFSCQALSKVPTELHDVPLATIITEQGILYVQ